jgi:replication factor C subunit 1
MYTIIYKPKNIDEFVGNKLIIKELIEWLLGWNEKEKKCALISGISGIGKSLIVELILKKYNYNIVNITLDMDINKDYMNDKIKPLIKTIKNYDGKTNVLVVSDIDCGYDYNFISSLTEFIKNTKIPILCICDNRYDQKIKPIVNYCIDLKMLKPSYQEIYYLIYNIIKKEKIKIKESEIKEMYESSNGDIRFILNNLQFGSKKSKKNIQSFNIFDTTSNLLSIDETLNDKYDTFWLSNDLHPLMVQENYITNTLCIKNDIRKLENISYSADALSDVDICNKFINSDLEDYIAFNTIRATTKCNKKIIKFSQFLGKITIINKNKSEKFDYENVKFFKNTNKNTNVNTNKPKKLKKTK